MRNSTCNEIRLNCTILTLEEKGLSSFRHCFLANFQRLQFFLFFYDFHFFGRQCQNSAERSSKTPSYNKHGLKILNFLKPLPWTFLLIFIGKDDEKGGLKAFKKVCIGVEKKSEFKGFVQLV